MCSVEGCERPVLARGWCSMHYARWRSHGDPLVVLTRSGLPYRGPTQCAVDGCERPSRKRGWCTTHYSRWQRQGDPLVVLPRGKFSGYTECTVCGATPVFGHGYCRLHHRRWYTHGDPNYIEARYVDQMTWDDPRDGQRFHYHKYRSALLGNDVRAVSSRDMRALLSMPCQACGSPDVELDHLVPVSRGGAHSVGNLIPLCRACNSSKNNLTWAEWRHSNRPRAVALFQ